MAEKMRLSHKRLLIFFSLSLFLHIIWFAGQHDYQVYIPDQPGSQMAIRLNKQQAPFQKSTATLNKQIDNAPAIQKNDAKQITSQNSAMQNQLNRASVLNEIKQKLTHHFSYPVMARRMGWQGRVLLGFRITKMGSIQAVHIKQSSGYTILDDSAMAALTKIGKITLHATDNQVGAWQLEIPIIYRLEG